MPLRTSLIVIMVLAASVLWAGCQIAGPDDPRNEDISTQKEKWDDFQDGTYSFLFNRGCFCAVGGEHFVQVIDGVVIDAFRTWDNQPVESHFLQYIETIDALFEMIERARREAHSLDVEYSEYGYPTLLSIDWIKNAVDDEIHFQVSNVQPGVQVID